MHESVLSTTELPQLRARYGMLTISWLNAVDGPIRELSKISSGQPFSMKRSRYVGNMPENMLSLPPFRLLASPPSYNDEYQGHITGLSFNSPGFPTASLTDCPEMVLGLVH
ncbi:hypothetical protein AcW1_009398 [Taiwanofungus camphoratus]|nr:hypothetical protein AcV5_003469 [Antrodia cinnamomea]KAI0947701.1 hypothetical protein AcW1_009398 [Antrodia cinnamomea]